MKSYKRRPTNNTSKPKLNNVNRQTWSPSKFLKTDGIRSQSKNNIPERGNEKLNEFIFEHSDTNGFCGPILNIKEYADVVFVVGGHVLYAHKAIVEVRCPSLLSVNLKEKPIQKGNLTHFKIDQKTLNELILYTILCYLYSDAVNFNVLKPNDVVLLIKAAEIYKLNRLVKLCEKYLHLLINEDLFFDLLENAESNSIENVKEICFRYGKLNFKSIILNKEKICSLGIELFREFVVFVENEKSVDEWPEIEIPKSTMLQDMKKVYESRHHCDGCFIFGEKRVKFHRGILNFQSEKIPTLLKFQSDPMKLILPKNVTMSPEAFETALSFIYYRNESFSSSIAAEITPFALSYDIKPLYKLCVKKVKEDINLESALPILRLCYHNQVKKHVADVYDPCLKFVANNFYYLDFNDKRVTSEMIADVLQLIQNHIKEGVFYMIS